MEHGCVQSSLLWNLRPERFHRYCTPEAERIGERIRSNLTFGSNVLEGESKTLDQAIAKWVDGEQSRLTNDRQCPGFPDDTRQLSMWITGQLVIF